MPRAPARACRATNCSNLTRHPSGYCDEHAALRVSKPRIRFDRSADKHRPSPSKRGYGKKWQKLRRIVLSQNPECAMCGAPATHVDHIVPLADGGTNDRENLQPLCHSCHTRKTLGDVRRRQGAAIR